MVKRILAVIITASFLVNSVCLADVFSVKPVSKVASETLSPESRLSPITDNSMMLDIMKLTAEMTRIASKELLELREKAVVSLDQVTIKTAQEGATRPGDGIFLDFRNKVIEGEAIFVPCWITGTRHGDAAATTRHYLCYAKKGAQAAYEFEFIPTNSKDLKKQDIEAALKDRVLLASLGKKSRPDEVKAGVARYVAQQNVDRYIADVITGRISRVKKVMLSMNDAFVQEAYKVLQQNNYKVAASFLRLVRLGQVMIIPGLQIPHAGGIGIYLPDTEEYKNSETFIHEIFAKCGMKRAEANAIAAVLDRKKMDSTTVVSESESQLITRARKADFPNRYDDVLNIDFNMWDQDTAENVALKRIADIAESLGLSESEWDPFTHRAAKVDADKVLARKEGSPDGKLILVTALTPTTTGEGKTCTSISLTQGLGRIGKKVVLGLRQPSGGPVYGLKGGAMGTGKARVVPGDWIDKGFTGDIDAVARAHNILAAAVRHSLYRQVNGVENRLNIDKDRIIWPYALDLNDAFLRSMMVGIEFNIATKSGKRHYDKLSHEAQTVIAVASEVMAILSIAKDKYDLRERLDKIIVAYDIFGNPVTAKDVEASGAMAEALEMALQPNLVQTIEGQPVFVHGGPFANIAHGCNSLRATQLALKLGDYYVTEAGFGADLGAEKFFDIKCRHAGLKPELSVLVVTAKALMEHSGLTKDTKPGVEMADCLERGFANIDRHIANLKKFGVPVLVAVNKFPNDSDEHLDLILKHCRSIGVKAEINDGVARGGEGSVALAEAAVSIIKEGKADFKPIYDLKEPIKAKIEKIAMEIYGADGVDYIGTADADIENIEKLGCADLAICMAKTQYSFSDNPALKGAPTGWRLHVREVRLSAGAGFIIPVTDGVSLMPALSLQTVPNYTKMGKDTLRLPASATSRLSDVSEEAKGMAVVISERLPESLTKGKNSPLNAVIDDLLVNKPLVCLELLKRGSPKGVAQAIVGRMALPWAAQVLPRSVLDAYVRYAKGNPETAPAAKAIEEKLAAQVADKLKAFMVPDEPSTITATVEEPFPFGIDKTVIDIAAAESAANKIVVFVSQDFAALGRCRELLPAFTNVEYVPFNQHTQLNELPALMSQPKYNGRKKVLITSDITADRMMIMVSANAAALREVIPINAGSEEFSGPEEHKSFQKGILSMSIMAASMPKDQATYKQSRSYMVLKSLLTKIFDGEQEAESYITNLVNPAGTLTVSTRFGFLIGRVIGPINRLVVNGFTRIVNIFA